MHSLYDKTVYLVEPDKAVRDSIKTLLESFDVTIHTYASGRSFLNNAKLNEHGCVLVESALPDMTGIDLCEKIALINSNVTLILLTSVNDSAFELINQAGVSAILQKPLKCKKLLEIIKGL